jgi:hypothetical protein
MSGLQSVSELAVARLTPRSLPLPVPGLRLRPPCLGGRRPPDKIGQNGNPGCAQVRLICRMHL